MLRSISNELKEGMVCEKKFESQGGMGKVYKTTEFMKVMKIDPKKHVLLEAVVKTKAPYGDKFRVLIHHEFTDVDGKSCRMKVTAAVVFIAPVNGIIKGMIEKGTREGMIKAQMNTVTVLRHFLEVSSGEEKKAIPKAARGPRKETLLEFVFGDRLVHAMEPWASLCQAFLGQVPVLSQVTSNQILWVSLSIMLLNIVRILLTIFQVMKEAAKASQSPTALALNFFFKVWCIVTLRYSIILESNVIVQ